MFGCIRIDWDNAVVRVYTTALPVVCPSCAAVVLAAVARDARALAETLSSHVGVKFACEVVP